LASFEEHTRQVRHNLKFLESINKLDSANWDWQVTTCFYIAVHLINAHIARKSDQHYRSHELVNNAINPFNRISITKLSEELYISYIKLQNLSRRARYLCHDNPENRSTSGHVTYEKHFSKSLYHLDALLTFIESEYQVKFETISIDSLDLKGRSFSHFLIN